jgi:pimeloyl-ACP methyl ester carboxylesterase
LAPEIAVVVASHARPLRLRWLLEARSEQTGSSTRWRSTAPTSWANSLSGRVALELCLRHPGRVRRLALLAPSLAWRRARWSRASCGG